MDQLDVFFFYNARTKPSNDYRGYRVPKNLSGDEANPGWRDMIGLVRYLKNTEGC